MHEPIFLFLPKRLASPRARSYFGLMRINPFVFRVFRGFSDFGFRPSDFFRISAFGFRVFWLAAAFFCTRLALPAADALPVVSTPRLPVTDSYHGVAIIDDYQWLENASAPQVREWTREENARTHAYFAELPYRDALAAQLTKLRSEESARYMALSWKNGRYFGLRFKPPMQQPVLIRLASLEPPANHETVFDPNQYNTNGTTAIDWYVPSQDGRRVAASLSEGGSENGMLHVFDVDTGKELSDVIPRVQYPTGGGSAAWNADGTGIFYTRYPKPGERPEQDIHFYQQLWFHKLGTPTTEDTYELGKDFPRIAEIVVETSDDGQWLLATVANGNGGDFAHYLRTKEGKWQQLTRFEDGIKQVKFGRDGALYLVRARTRHTGKFSACR